MAGAAGNLHEALIEFAPDALIVADRHDLIQRVNRRADALFGYDRDDLLGRPLDDLVAEQSRPAFAEFLAVGRELPVELTGRARDGTEFPVEVTRARLSAAGVVVLAVRDVRARQSVQQLLWAEQMMAIGQVAAGVAHELRNPLTSIKGLVQVNRREAAARGVPDEDLAVIEHEIRRMERTLQTFLDFARPPKPNRRRLDLATVVDRVYALVGGRARKQRVELRRAQSEGPRWVDGDQDQLQQLLLNLVLNALDAMPRGGTVTVELDRPHETQVELQVCDTGPGIAAHILPKVFETFVSSKETGVGLGLPLSRRIAEDHGGSLTAHNLPAGGACFTLRLPLARPE